MATVLIRHTVNDYATWKKVYDETKPMAKSRGVRRQRLLKNSANPNELVVLSEFENMNQAREFAQSAELKQAMQRAGVAGEPAVFFLEEAENVPL